MAIVFGVGLPNHVALTSPVTRSTIYPASYRNVKRRQNLLPAAHKATLIVDRLARNVAFIFGLGTGVGFGPFTRQCERRCDGSKERREDNCDSKQPRPF